MPSMTGNSIHADMLRATAFIKNYLKNISKEQIMIMATAIYTPYFAGGKATLSIVISDSLAKEKDLHAGNLVRESAKLIQGGGGGQPFFATAGGKDTSGLENAIAQVKGSVFK